MKNWKLMRALSIMMVATILTAMAACSNEGRRGGPGGPSGGKQGPPPEAIQACEGKQEGDSVTFSGRNGESMSGTCKMINNQLAAVPEGHKRPQ